MTSETSFWNVDYKTWYTEHIMIAKWSGCGTVLLEWPSNIIHDHKLPCLSWIICNESSWYVLDHYVVRMLMRYHQCSIMLVQLQCYIIADIQVHCNIILMYVYNIYLGISSPPQFPDAVLGCVRQFSWHSCFCESLDPSLASNRAWFFGYLRC